MDPTTTILLDARKNQNRYFHLDTKRILATHPGIRIYYVIHDAQDPEYAIVVANVFKTYGYTSTPLTPTLDRYDLLPSGVDGEDTDYDILAVPDVVDFKDNEAILSMEGYKKKESIKESIAKSNKKAAEGWKKFKNNFSLEHWWRGLLIVISLVLGALFLVWVVRKLIQSRQKTGATSSSATATSPPLQATALLS